MYEREKSRTRKKIERVAICSTRGTHLPSDCEETIGSDAVIVAHEHALRHRRVENRKFQSEENTQRDVSRLGIAWGARACPFRSVHRFVLFAFSDLLSIDPQQLSRGRDAIGADRQRSSIGAVRAAQVASKGAVKDLYGLNLS